jgi:hypothetical protein
MQDVTPLFNNYRECARVLRNTYFRAEPHTGEALELAARFKEIDEILFRALVLWNLKRQAFHRTAGEPVPFLRVAPSTTGVPLRVPRPGSDGQLVWEDFGRLTDLEADFRFIEYYDLQETGYVDYRYFRVKIVAFPDHPELEGADALLDTHHAKVFFLEEAD